MSIKENLNTILKTIPKDVTLVAVSKTKPVTAIQEAYNAGQRIFGENRIQEMAEKYEALPKDIKWHMIGHVQRNKVKYMAEFVSLIHAVDNLKLLKEINKQAQKHNRIINCLLQLKIADEESKHGMNYSELTKILNSDELVNYKNINIVGLMGMATFTDNEHQVAKEFSTLKKAFDTHAHIQTENCNLQTLSMGMSGDYKIAISCGSTMVRIGSSIFGARTYNK